MKNILLLFCVSTFFTTVEAGSKTVSPLPYIFSKTDLQFFEVDCTQSWSLSGGFSGTCSNGQPFSYSTTQTCSATAASCAEALIQAANCAATMVQNDLNQAANQANQNCRQTTFTDEP